MATSSISTCQSHWLRRGLEPSMVAVSSVWYRCTSLVYRCSWILPHSLRACHPLCFLRGPYHPSSKAQPQLQHHGLPLPLLHHKSLRLLPHPYRPRGCHPLRFLRSSLPRFSRQQNPNPNLGCQHPSVFA